jgi:hypothetical protein
MPVLSVPIHLYFHSTYGSPEVDQTIPKTERVTVSQDGKGVRLFVDTLQKGHIHELHLDGVRSRDTEPLLHREA